MHPGVRLEAWCALLLDGFSAAGAREIVVSPGSRSTPLVLAAAADARFSVEVIVDERAAAFYALGRSRVTGRPPVLVRTSGSASGHDLPAVIEAFEAALPLVIVTADRPPELAGVRAPQTIDQTRLFGAFAVGFYDLGTPEDDPLSLRAVRRAGLQAATLAQHPRPGPVQVNLRARKPLEPPERKSEADRSFERRVRELRTGPAPRIHLPDPEGPSTEGLEAILEGLRQARRPLIIAGPAAPRRAFERESILQVLERIDAPAFLEATSQLRLGPGGLGTQGLEIVLAVDALRPALAPDFILQWGDPPISSALQASLAAWPGLRHLVVAPAGYPDPSSRAEVIRADCGRTARALLEAGLSPPRIDPTYRRRWREAQHWAQTLTAEVSGSPELTEAEVVRAARDAVPDGGWLMVGNSLPVRHLDVYVASGGPQVQVLHQRGASGIDGLVAGAIGAAQERPGVLLLGDVSLRHDLGGLALAPMCRAPLTIVVIHNGGGRIFERLPLASRLGRDSEAMRPFTTPNAGSLAPVAEALGFRTRVVGTFAELQDALSTSSGLGPRLIEARVPPHEATQTHFELLGRVFESLSACWGEGTVRS